MTTLKQIDRTIESLFENIAFPSEPQGLYEPLKYMIEIGGKRIRPRLCLICYSLFQDELTPAALGAAQALEVFHSFTLIHDDIMDCSPLRRGKETVWHKWDENTAILSGDVMCIDSYRRLCEVPAEVLPDALALFGKTAAQVCEGQQYDMDFESRDRVSMEEYMNMIGLKTGVLIACSACMGGIIGGADKEQRKALYDYGYLLGLAFQIADDYLDTFGDEKIFGKPIGGDILNDKKTWLLTRAFEKSEGSNILQEALQLKDPAKKIAAVKAAYESLGVKEDATKEILRLHSLALEKASLLGLEEEKFSLLKEYADALIGRRS